MIVVIGEFRIPLEHAAEASAAMAKVIAASRAETGCLAYSYAEDLLEKGLFRVSEAWESREALHAAIRRFRREAAGRCAVEHLIGISPAMQLARRQVEAAAASGCNVCIAGPPGAGPGSPGPAGELSFLSRSLGRVSGPAGPVVFCLWSYFPTFLLSYRSHCHQFQSRLE